MASGLGKFLYKSVGNSICPGYAGKAHEFVLLLALIRYWVISLNVYKFCNIETKHYCERKNRIRTQFIYYNWLHLKVPRIDPATVHRTLALVSRKYVTENWCFLNSQWSPKRNRHICKNVYWGLLVGDFKILSV